MNWYDWCWSLRYCVFIIWCQICVSLTFDINGDGGRFGPELILSFTEILSRVWRLDGTKDELLPLVQVSGGVICIILEPGVVSCWVSITAAAQSHWTALHYFTRGTSRSLRGSLEHLITVTFHSLYKIPSDWIHSYYLHVVLYPSRVYVSRLFIGITCSCPADENNKIK